MTPELAIETRGLKKSYGPTEALAGLDLNVRRGTIHGVLGPNGAGKSTAIKILTTLLRPTEGSATVFGLDVVRDRAAIRRRIAMTGQTMSVDEDLTGRQNLVLAGRLQGLKHSVAVERAQQLLEVMELADVGSRLLKTYSVGQRRRIDIAGSMVVTPELLFLDEPTTGLDPRARNEIWSIVRALVADGGTVLLTTQYLDEADQLADRLTLIDRGRVVAEGTPTDLKARTASGVLNVGLLDPGRVHDAGTVLARALGAEVDIDAAAARLSVRVPDPNRAAAALGELAGAGIQVSNFALDQAALDEVFLALTGHKPTTDETVREVEARA